MIIIIIINCIVSNATKFNYSNNAWIINYRVIRLQFCINLLRFKPLIHEVVKHFEGAGPKPQNSEKVKEHQVSQSFTTTVFL
jgi:hypothetical protein